MSNRDRIEPSFGADSSLHVNPKDPAFPSAEQAIAVPSKHAALQESNVKPQISIWWPVSMLISFFVVATFNTSTDIDLVDVPKIMTFLISDPSITNFLVVFGTSLGMTLLVLAISVVVTLLCLPFKFGRRPRTIKIIFTLVPVLHIAVILIAAGELHP